MKFAIPFRLVRATNLRRIHTEAQAAEEAAEVYSDEATQWREHYLAEAKRAETAEHSAERAEETIESQGEQLTHLRRLLDETAAELEGAYAHTRAELDDHRAELTAQLDKLFTAASDPNTGSEFRGRLALGVLRAALADQPDNDSPSVLLLSALLFRDDEDAEENTLAGREEARQ